MTQRAEPPSIAVSRHPAGRGSAVSPPERIEIQRAYLVEPNATITTLAKQFGRTRTTIAQLLKGPDFDSLKQQIHAELAEEAREILRKNVVRVAGKWAGLTVDQAAAKGDHRPMRDLLTAVNVIDSEHREPHVTIQIGINASDVALVPVLPASSPK